MPFSFVIALMWAAVILNIDHSGASDSASSLVDPNYNLGVIFVLVASMLSGVSAALTQKVLSPFFSPLALTTSLCTGAHFHWTSAKLLFPIGRASGVWHYVSVN